MQFQVLYQDENLLVIDKPEGMHVHNPEIKGVRVPREQVILPLLRDQMGKWVYPIHRLDAATSGCLLWAFSSEIASVLSAKLREGLFQKHYHAVVRGWLEDEFSVEIPLASESDPQKLLEAKTLGRRLAQIEHDVTVGIRHSKARYSLLELEAVTGRYHQLRRHLARISRPIVGDVAHGDRHQNRYFRETLKISGLCLRAVSLSFPDPCNPDHRISIKASQNPKWVQIEKLFY